MPRKKKPQTLLEKFQANETLTSRVLGTAVVVVIGILLFNYFQGINPEVIAPEGEQPDSGNGEIVLTEENGKIVPEALPRQYTVQDGDSLWTIAESNYGSGYNWVDIAQANTLNNANLLTSGQVLTLPRVAVREPATTRIEEQKQAVSITSSEYTVQKGDSLWDIAIRAYNDGYRWTKIALENKLENPNVIHPGNTLRLPR